MMRETIRSGRPGDKADSAKTDKMVLKKGFQIQPQFEHKDLKPVDLRPGKVKTDLVKKEEALPGHSEPMRVSDQHYVLQTPMKGPWPPQMQVFVFANGCFWGSEKGIWRLPGGGVHSTAVGYAGGFTPNPTYEEVCTGRTGHTEAVQVVFDPQKISLVDILRWFWESHDPTQGFAQGNDRGSQYRSAVFCFNEEQRQLCMASKDAYQKELTALGKGKGPSITTELKDMGEECVFYYAEDEHQQYLAKPGARPYCSAQPLQISLRSFKEWAPADLRAKFAPQLDESFWRLHGPKPHCVINAPTEPIQWAPSTGKATSKKKDGKKGHSAKTPQTKERPAAEHDLIPPVEQNVIEAASAAEESTSPQESIQASKNNSQSFKILVHDELIQGQSIIVSL